MSEDNSEYLMGVTRETYKNFDVRELLAIIACLVALIDERLYPDIEEE